MLYSFSLIILFVLGLITPKTKEKENVIENIVLITIINDSSSIINVSSSTIKSFTPITS